MNLLIALARKFCSRFGEHESLVLSDRSVEIAFSSRCIRYSIKNNPIGVPVREHEAKSVENLQRSTAYIFPRRLHEKIWRDWKTVEYLGISV